MKCNLRDYNKFINLRKRIFKYIKKSLKNSVMSDQKFDKSKHADTVIRNHVIWSMGAGLIPVLVADIFAVSALQLDMIRQLCRVYDIDFSETQGKAIVTSLTSSTLARLGAGSVVKIIPGLGSILGGVTVSVFAGASTYALGEVFKKHFESGGTILDFDPARLRNLYKQMFEKGKKVAQDLKNQDVQESEPIVEAPPAPQSEPSANSQADVMARLRELGEMKEMGIITQEEFEEMKKKLLSQF